MGEKRICPRCRKLYPKDVDVCAECGEVLADISEEFEMVLAMMKEPVLLANGWDVDLEYLRQALRKRAVPFYTEECMRPVPTDSVKSGGVKIVPTVNLYVDQREWEEALEALSWAMEETRKDDEAPEVFLDMPEEEADDALEDPDVVPKCIEDAPEKNGLMRWFLALDMPSRLAVAAMGGVFLLGIIAILFS